MAKQTMKRSMTTDDETWEVRSKNTPAITAYRHRCRQRERNGDLRDCYFKYFYFIPLYTSTSQVSQINFYLYSPVSQITIRLKRLYNLHSIRLPLSLDPRSG